MKLILLLFLSAITILSQDLYNDYISKDKNLSKAIELYLSLHLDESENLLEETIPKLTDRRDLALAYKTKAFIHTLKQEQKKAEDSYNKLFKIYPDYKIDFATVSPKISDFFKDYHSIWLRMPSDKIKLYPVAIKEVKYKNGVQLPVEWHDPKMEAGEVIVYYKTDSTQSYSSSKKNDITTENYIAYFDLAFFTKPEYNFTLTYYIEVFNYNGKKIATLGSLDNPQIIDVVLPKGAKKSSHNKKSGSWYTSTWFLATVGVAVLATAGGAYYFSTQDSPAPDATLSITFQE